MNAVLLKLHLNVYEELDHCKPFYVDDFGAARSCAVMGLFLFTVERSYQQ